MYYTRRDKGWEAGEGGGGGGFAEEALGGSEAGLPGLDLGVGDGDGVAAGVSEDAEDVSESWWVGDGDAAGNGAGAGSGGPGLASEGGYDGHDGLGLYHMEFREGVDSPAALQFS